MKKLLCLSVLFFVPAITHAQSRSAGMTPSTLANANASGAANATGGSGGGSIGGGSFGATPGIARSHGASHGVHAYTNPGPFEPTEVLSWKQAIELGQPKPEKDLATVARETREQRTKDGNAPRVITN